MKKTPVILREVWKHPLDYLLLLAGLLTLTILYIFFQGLFAAQLAIGISVGVGYVTWGIWHHQRSDLLTKHVIREYCFAGLLASAMLIMLAL